MGSTQGSTAPAGTDIRRYRPEDREKVLALYGRVRGSALSADARRLWAWQYESNPFHPPDGLLYWVIDGPGEGLAAQMATMPIRLMVEGRERPSAWGVDLMVDPACRGGGIANKLLLHWTQSLEVTLGKGIADIAYHIATSRLSWREIGPTYRHVKLVDPRRTLRGEFGNPLVQRVAGVAGMVLDRALTRAGAPREELQRREPAHFGDEADALWASIACSFTYAPVRNRAYLHWRYVQHPFHVYRSLVLERDGRTAGCAVMRSTPDRRGRRVLQIMELLADPSGEGRGEDGGQGALNALIGGTIEEARREKADYVVALVTDRRIQRRLSRHGFVRRRAPETRLIGEFGRLDVQPSRILSAENWLVTMGDADSEIG